ncbi:hypothetical protein [Neptuniibacter sp. QD37_11]|uniref:hypothetical protein n=1 Tax=Neptuniibacter sp. QD37_11 TaxID=3398209 RepID=UPI0039F4678B
MQESRSKFIALESVPITDLAKRPAGACGIYFLAEVEGHSASEVRQKISSNAKAIFAKEKRKCEVQSALVTTGFDESGDITTTKQIIVRVL